MSCSGVYPYLVIRGLISAFLPSARYILLDGFVVHNFPI